MIGTNKMMKKAKTQNKKQNAGGGYFTENPSQFSDKAPSHIGVVSIGDDQYRLAAWPKKNEKGFMYWSFSLRED